MACKASHKRRKTWVRRSWTVSPRSLAQACNRQVEAGMIVQEGERMTAVMVYAKCPLKSICHSSLGEGRVQSARIVCLTLSRLSSMSPWRLRMAVIVLLAGHPTLPHSPDPATSWPAHGHPWWDTLPAAERLRHAPPSPGACGCGLRAVPNEITRLCLPEADRVPPQPLVAGLAADGEGPTTQFAHTHCVTIRPEQ